MPPLALPAPLGAGFPRALAPRSDGRQRERGRERRPAIKAKRASDADDGARDGPAARPGPSWAAPIHAWPRLLVCPPADGPAAKMPPPPPLWLRLRRRPRHQPAARSSQLAGAAQISARPAGGPKRMIFCRLISAGRNQIWPGAVCERSQPRSAWLAARRAHGAASGPPTCGKTGTESINQSAAVAPAPSWLRAATSERATLQANECVRCR